MTPSVAHLPLLGVMGGFRRFSIPEYHRMAQLCILTEDDNIELLEGYLVHHHRPRTPLHDGTLSLVFEYLLSIIPDGWRVRNQSGVTLSDSEPEPDLAIVRIDPADYMQHHPGPADIALVIEVADSSLDGDRADKCRIYARAGIQEYWIVNLVDTQIEVYSSPVNGGYAQTRRVLGLSLASALNAPIQPTQFGIFRM